jgi:hypothetical protein
MSKWSIYYTGPFNEVIEAEDQFEAEEKFQDMQRDCFICEPYEDDEEDIEAAQGIL